MPGIFTASRFYASLTCTRNYNFDNPFSWAVALLGEAIRATLMVWSWMHRQFVRCVTARTFRNRIAEMWLKDCQYLFSCVHIDAWSATIGFGVSFASGRTSPVIDAVHAIAKQRRRRNNHHVPTLSLRTYRPTFRKRMCRSIHFSRKSAREGGTDPTWIYNPKRNRKSIRQTLHDWKP